MTPDLHILLKLRGNTSHFVIIASKAISPHAAPYLRKTPLIYCARSPRISLWEADCRQMRHTEPITLKRHLHVLCFMHRTYMPQKCSVKVWGGFFDRMQVHFHKSPVLYSLLFYTIFSLVKPEFTCGSCLNLFCCSWPQSSSKGNKVGVHNLIYLPIISHFVNCKLQLMRQ